MQEMIEDHEALTIEFVCRLSLVLCELDALSEKVASAPPADQDLLRSSLTRASTDLDGIVSLLSVMPLGQVRH